MYLYIFGMSFTFLIEAILVFIFS